MQTTETSPPVYPARYLAWAMWSLAALFYFYTFYQRIAPAVMTRELMQDFGISASALGHLSAFYFYGYTLMQIPTGMLADAWGPRKLLTAGALVAAAGTMMFGLAGDMTTASVGRLFIGGSTAVTFVCMLKLSSHWMPPNQFAMSAGMQLVIGSLGAIGAGAPLRMLVGYFGWRSVVVYSGFFALAVAAAVWIWLRDDPGQKGYKSYASDQDKSVASPFAGLGRVLRARNTWLMCLAPAGLVGPVLAFSGLWGVPYLQARYGVDQASAAAVCSALLVSWALCSPFVGRLSDYFGRRKPIYFAGCLLAFVSWLLMLYAPLPLWGFAVLAVFCGLGNSVMTIAFAFGKESVPFALAGTVSGVINAGVMLGPTILQPAIGWVLDQHWAGQMEAGARIYGLDAYAAGFTPLLIWSGLSCVLILFAGETYCRQSK